MMLGLPLKRLLVFLKQLIAATIVHMARMIKLKKYIIKT